MYGRKEAARSKALRDQACANGHCGRGYGVDHNQLHMNQVILDFLRDLRQTQYQAPEWIARYQRHLLDPLLRHAREHVPFYRDNGRLDPLFRCDGMIDWNSWAEIPRLTRAEVQTAGEQLRALWVPPEHGGIEQHVTSGSSGEPVKVWHTLHFNPGVRTAVNMRNFERHGVDPSQRLAFLYPFTPHDFDIRYPRRQGTRTDRFSEFGLTGERIDVADTRPARELIDALVSIRPKFIRAQPIILDLMCAYDRDRRLSDLGVATVFAVGDYFSTEAKQRVSEHLGCWIIDSYGSVECGRLANSCPHCDHLHVEAETVLLEVVNKSGSATVVGAEGDVIVTTLHNYAMPLIRYDLDDRAIVGPSHACSIALPTLEAVFGRKRTLFVFAGEVAVAPLLPLDAIVKYLDAQAFQVAQVAPDRCEFRFVPGRIKWSDMRFEEMTKLMRAMWWDRLQVEYIPVDHIRRRSPRGKLASYVQEMSLESLPTAVRAVTKASRLT